MPKREGLVIFATTAGPRRGFGHLVRCGVLADALGVNRVAVLRSVSSSSVRAARRLGWNLLSWRSVSTSPTRLLVVDDPSPDHTRTWVRRGRQLGVPVATIHDGRSHRATADLVIDGSAASPHHSSDRRVSGPAFAVLRNDRTGRTLHAARERSRILVALGGGAHVKQSGARVASAILRRLPHLRVHLAAGLAGGRLPALPRGARWIAAPKGLADELSRCSACVVAGGVTLYEACALGVPTVAIAVVDPQRPAIRAAVRAGAALTASLASSKGADTVANLVCRLVHEPVLQRALIRRAQRLVDGRGTERVAARLAGLMRHHQKELAHAAA